MVGSLYLGLQGLLQKTKLVWLSYAYYKYGKEDAVLLGGTPVLKYMYRGGGLFNAFTFFCISHSPNE